jgi:hypothetical protein
MRFSGGGLKRDEAEGKNQFQISSNSGFTTPTRHP